MVIALPATETLLILDEAMAWLIPNIMASDLSGLSARQLCIIQSLTAAEHFSKASNFHHFDQRQHIIIECHQHIGECYLQKPKQCS